MALHIITIKYPGGTREKIVGAVLTENNFTDAEKEKLANVGELTPEQLAEIAEQVLEQIGTIPIFDGFSKITIGSLPPENPSENDLWIDTN